MRFVKDDPRVDAFTDHAGTTEDYEAILEASALSPANRERARAAHAAPPKTVPNAPDSRGGKGGFLLWDDEDF